MEQEMDYEAWVKFGVDKGWVSYPACDTHEGTPHTEEEDKEWEEGGDPCVLVMRVWG